jgi:hypothetical protein
MMKDKISIEKMVVHIVGRELTEAEKEANEIADADKKKTDITYQVGRLGGPDLHDVNLESHEIRRNLKGREGWICLGVRAGEELGDISIAIQFEGPTDRGHGEPDLCIDGQNRLLEAASGWIAEVLGSLEADFDGTIETEPCPKATKPLAIVEAVQRLDSSVTTSTRVIVNPVPEVLIKT